MKLKFEIWGKLKGLLNMNNSYKLKTIKLKTNKLIG